MQKYFETNNYGIRLSYTILLANYLYRASQLYAFKMTKINSCKGTYAIVFSSDQESCICIGKLGKVKIEKGFYVYIGSAFGPGGLRSRINRHLKRGKPNHWHIDYIRDQLLPIGVWYSYASVKEECHWAKILHEFSDSRPLNKMGATDCKCPSHFFSFKSLSFSTNFSKSINNFGADWVEF